MHEVWTFNIVIIGPMVEWLHTHTHWILETKQEKPNQRFAKSSVYDNITLVPFFSTKVTINCLRRKQ